MKKYFLGVILTLPFQPILVMHIQATDTPVRKISFLEGLPEELIQQIVLSTVHPVKRANIFSILCRTSKKMKQSLCKISLPYYIYTDFILKNPNKKIAQTCPLLRTVQANNMFLLKNLLGYKKNFKCKQVNCGLLLLMEARKRDNSGEMYRILLESSHVKKTRINLQKAGWFYDAEIEKLLLNKNFFNVDLKKANAEFIFSIPAATKRRIDTHNKVIIDFGVFPLMFAKELINDSDMCGFLPGEFKRWAALSYMNLVVLPVLLTFGLSGYRMFYLQNPRGQVLSLKDKISLYSRRLAHVKYWKNTQYFSAFSYSASLALSLSILHCDRPTLATTSGIGLFILIVLFFHSLYLSRYAYRTFRDLGN